MSYYRELDSLPDEGEKNMYGKDPKIGPGRIGKFEEYRKRGGEGGVGQGMIYNTQ
jgi:hypothetical protein